MKSFVVYLLAGTAMLCPMNGSSEESAPATPAPAKDPKDDFLPDWNFSGKVYQVTANPIVWNDDRSLAVIWEDTGADCYCYTFWCLKRNAQGMMTPIAKYTVWSELSKKGILLDEKGLTVIMEGSTVRPGTTTISHHFPFTIPQAKISFLRQGQERLNGVGKEDLEKEWKRFMEQ